MLVAITGAGGKTGRAVISALLARGATVRALVRTPAHAERIRALGEVEAVVGDLLEPTEIAAALEGARSLYHIPPNMHPAEQEIGAAVLAAAADVAVPHFVYHSVLHPQLRAMPHHWRKLKVEEAVLESDLPSTILEPGAYMQNLKGAFTAAADSGVYAVPYGGSVRLSLVDVDDVAAAAAVVLTEDPHRGATYELAGAEAPSQEELAALMGEVLGRPVRFERRALDQWAADAGRRGLSPQAIQDFEAMFRHYDRHDFIGNPTILTWLLGRPPTSLVDVLRRWRGRPADAKPTG